MKKSILNLLLMLVLVFITIACGSDDENKNVLEENGFKVYNGDNPPDIIGSYQANSIEMFYNNKDEAKVPSSEVKYIFKVSKYNDKNIGVEYSYIGTGTGSGGGFTGKISGKNNCFTVIANHFSSEEPSHFISGCIDESQNIIDFKRAKFFDDREYLKIEIEKDGIMEKLEE